VPLFLKPGDDMHLGIQGLGEQRQQVVASDEPVRPKNDQGLNLGDFDEETRRNGPVEDCCAGFSSVMLLNSW
jgi:hypothetical protein